MARDMKVYAGMDIGGTKVALGVFGEDKTLLGKTKYPSDASLSAEEFFQQAAAQLRALLGRCPAGGGGKAAASPGSG